uniref:Uncharacterized protein n=1 Tax=Rhizophora mucronata TaxID=61149 RepID=A0A2P2N6F2_RHIMU
MKSEHIIYSAKNHELNTKSILLIKKYLSKAYPTSIGSYNLVTGYKII